MPRYRLRTLLIVLVSLVTLPIYGQDKPDPGEPLYGDWEIVEMTFRQKVQTLPRQPVGYFMIEKGGFIWILYGDAKDQRDKILADKSHRRIMTLDCTIEPGVIHVQDRYDKKLKFTALYEIKDGILRFVWNEVSGEKPADFDVMKDPSLALYVAKRVR